MEQTIKTKENELGLLNQNDLKEQLGLSTNTLYRWKKNKYLPYKQIGRKSYYDINEVREWLNKSNEVR